MLLTKEVQVDDDSITERCMRTYERSLTDEKDEKDRLHAGEGNEQSTSDALSKTQIPRLSSRSNLEKVAVLVAAALILASDEGFVQVVTSMQPARGKCEIGASKCEIHCCASCNAPWQSLRGPLGDAT
jgi:hypothetical protein